LRVAIVGAGILGLATAYQILLCGARVTIIEKEDGVGRHPSSHNSGVLHAGLYYQPGSLKARLAVSGIRQMIAFCRDNEIPHEICGKLVVATDPSQVIRLRSLHERGTRNGLRGLRWLSEPEVRELEPYCAGMAALHVPEGGIVDYRAVCEVLRRKVMELGGEVHTGRKVLGVRQHGAEWRLGTGSGDYAADFIVGCAGLHSDRVAALAGEPRSVRIVPFRGEYYKLREDRQYLVRNLIYPVPDPAFPFLGVHFTRLIRGGVEAGPNAVLAI
jgi:(S)-2-hydroxyglutarate dehydrogenase